MLIVSLTSVPPRFAGIGPALRSLASQSAVDAVELWLPPDFVRFPGRITPPVVPGGVTLRWAERDFGPATKLIPARAAHPEAEILCCDDDWVYGPGWAEGFAAAARAHPGAAIAASTYDSRRLGVGAGRIVQGFAGVLLPHFVPAPILRPPEGPCRYVDDVWLSAQLAAAGVPVIEVAALRQLASPAGNEAAPLQGYTDRAALNRDCVQMAQAQLGVWQD